MIKIVIDTNVIVSAMLDHDGIPAGIIKKIRNKDLKVFVDERIMDEYTRVLSYDKFEFNKVDIDLFLFFLRNNAAFVEKCAGLPGVSLPKDDMIFLEVAVKAQAEFLITGNSKHFNFDGYKDCRIIKPADFIKLSC